jgi:DNA topoisomerase-6 subunit B
LLVHVASTKIPFTSEAKEALAEDEDLDREITLAIQAAARHLKTHLSRVGRRQFASDKFAIIQKILPRLAEKASRLIDRPVPDLAPVITKIMDVVTVEPKVVVDPKSVRATVEITNYTARARVLELFLEVAPEILAQAQYAPAPEGTEAGLGRAWWTLEKLASNARTRIELRFPAKTDVEVNDLDFYVAGVDEAHLLGADPLPGDWDVRLPRAIIEAAETAEAASADEEEVDYDAAEASAHVSEDEG